MSAIVGVDIRISPFGLRMHVIRLDRARLGGVSASLGTPSPNT
jgi:hypothetical protein